MEKEIKDELKQKDELVKVTLKCGRNMTSEGGYDNGCEDWTSNQTSATCC